MVDSKRCPICGLNKLIEQFFKKQPQEDEREKLCKVCYMAKIAKDTNRKDQ